MRSALGRLGSCRHCRSSNHRRTPPQVYQSLARAHNGGMEAGETKQYSIGEFASYHLAQDQGTGTFTITIKGDLKYALLIAHRIGNLTVSDADIKELVQL